MFSKITLLVIAVSDMFWLLIFSPRIKTPTNITIDNIGIEINNKAVEILRESEGIRPLNRDDFNSTNTTIPSSVEMLVPKIANLGLE